MKEFLRKHPFYTSIALFLCLAVLFGTASVLLSRTWKYTIPHGAGDVISDIEAEFVTEDGEPFDTELLTLKEAWEKRTSTRLLWKASSSGRAQLRLHYTQKKASGEEIKFVQGISIRVTRSGIIAAGAGIVDYAGFPIVYYGFMLFALLETVYLLWYREESQKKAYYSYRAMMSLSGAFYFGILFLMYLLAALIALVRGEETSVKLMMLFTGNLTTAYLLLTIPLIVAFSLAVAVSNLELIRHEGKRLSNMLGILSGVLLLGGTAAVAVLFFLNYKIGQERPVVAILYAVSSACFSVFQVMLVGAVVSCFRAWTRKVPYGKKYIVILGCGIRKDGTLYPLIRGRVDRAIAFWKEQAEATGEKAVFVPSGGQGKDEVIPEAEAMKRYLIKQGIPEEYILPETRSSNTMENMAFSKALIESQEKDAKVVYSTTNYHVFRSGILAEKAGLKADGIGSRTKWYFWPNALLREVVGMFAVQPKMQLLMAVGLVLLAGAFGYLYSLLG